MPSVKVKDKQTFLDIAVLTSGSAEAAFSLAQLNWFNLTDDIFSGQVLITAGVIDEDVVNILKARDARPASADTGILEGDTGIDFWAIEDDFIVE